MRVVQLIARLNVGGPARVIDTLARGLPSECDVLVWRGETRRGEADHLRLHGEIQGAGARVPGLRPEVRPHDDARAAIWLAHKSRRQRPDLVHSHTTKAGLFARVPGPLPASLPRVHTFHGHVLGGYFSAPVTEAVRRAERLLARRTDALVAVSTRVRDELLSAGIGVPEQYAVIPPGVRLPELPDREAARRSLGLIPEQPVVAYVGRLTAIKRPDRLVELAEQLSRSHPAATLLVAGGGDLANVIAEATRRLPDGALRPLGWRRDVATVYAASDIVVITSDNEGTPMSLMEAQTAGVPVVATPVGGVPDVVEHERTGLLTEPGDLHGCVAALIDDPEWRAALGKAALAASADYHAERMVAAHLELYRRVLAG